jgi:hypothetical protein
MPPASSIRTFVSALKTGETRTTKALEDVTARRRGANAEEMIAALRRRNALDRPLQPALRQAIKRTSKLPDRLIDRCIDAWPDTQKERARKAMVRAINDGKRLHFRWGLTASGSYETEVTTSRGRVTITALSPRSTLRVSGDEVYAGPVRPV